MHISIPKHASDIIKTLSSHGYEAFVVGGCVRDSILGKEPGRLGYYNFRSAGTGEGFVSKNNRYRFKTWYRYDYDG